MFPSGYFAPRYFAIRYWPPGVGEVISAGLVYYRGRIIWDDNTVIAVS